MSLESRYSKDLLAPGLREGFNSLPKSMLMVMAPLMSTRDDNTPWGDWIDELAIVKQPGPNVPRLSGDWNQTRLVFRYCTR